MENKITKKDLRKFGVIFGLLLCSSAAYHYFKEDVISYWTSGVGVFALLSGLFVPILVKPLYFALRTLFRGFMWVLTRVVLILVYIVTIIPIGIAMKLYGKDPMDRKIEKDKNSYWAKRKDFNLDKEYLLRQF